MEPKISMLSEKKFSLYKEKKNIALFPQIWSQIMYVGYL